MALGLHTAHMRIGDSWDFAGVSLGHEEIQHIDRAALAQQAVLASWRRSQNSRSGDVADVADVGDVDG